MAQTSTSKLRTRIVKCSYAVPSSTPSTRFSTSLATKSKVHAFAPLPPHSCRHPLLPCPGAPMTIEQNETVAALRKNAYESEQLLKTLLQSRQVPRPLVRKNYSDNDESNEWSDGWKDVVRRRRCVASCCHARTSVCDCEMCNMQLMPLTCLLTHKVYVVVRQGGSTRRSRSHQKKRVPCGVVNYLNKISFVFHQRRRETQSPSITSRFLLAARRDARCGISILRCCGAADGSSALLLHGSNR